MKPSIVISILIGVAALSLMGCKEKPKAEQVIEDSKSATHEAGDAIKDAAEKTGKAVEHTAEQAWEGMKKGAREVGHVVTNMAGEVKAEAGKVGEKVKEAAK